MIRDVRLQSFFFIQVFHRWWWSHVLTFMHLEDGETIFNICSVFVPRTRTLSVISRLGWLSLIIMYSRVSYCYYYLNLIGYVIFYPMSFLKDVEFVPTVQWRNNPPVHIRHTVYRIIVSTCSLKNTGMISSRHRICAVRIFFASCCLRIDIDLYIDFT
jgi:hypothetical protein